MKKIKSNLRAIIQSSQLNAAREELEESRVTITSSQAEPDEKIVGYVAPPDYTAADKETKVSDTRQLNDQRVEFHTTEKAHKPQIHSIKNEGSTTMNNNFFNNLVTICTRIVSLLAAILRLVLVVIIGAAVIVNSYSFMSTTVKNNPELAEDMPAIVELLDNSKEVAGDSANFLLDVQTSWNDFWSSEEMTNPDAARSITDEAFFQIKLGVMKLRNSIIPDTATNIEAPNK